MESVFMITLAGIRKSKRQLVSQLIIMFLAAMLLNLGLLMAFRFEDYFDDKADELNAAHFTIAFRNALYNEKYFRFLQTHDETIATQKDDIFVLPGSQSRLKMPNSNMFINIFCMDYDQMGSMSQINIIGETLPANENAIYVPYALKICTYDLTGRYCGYSGIICRYIWFIANVGTGNGPQLGAGV